MSAAIVQLVTDIAAIERVLAEKHIALQGADRAVDRLEAQATSARTEQARRRVELGAGLIEARKQWPARGPNAKGWGEMLERVGLSQDSALRYMALAGYQSEVSRTHPDVRETEPPTYAEAGIDKRPRQGVTAPVQMSAPVPMPLGEPLPHRNNIDRALVTLNKAVFAYAKSWPSPSRAQLAQCLRDAAAVIDAMAD